MATILIATLDGQAFDSLSSEVLGEGHDVLWATDGKDACDLAPGADIVFVDPALPIFNAFEVASILRGDPSVPRDLPILLLADDPVEPHLFERAGFTGQFRKSHSYCDVRELLSTHITPETPSV